MLRIFSTGGTIDKVYFDEKSAYEVGEPLIHHILNEAQVTLDYAVTPLMRKDSLELTDEDRQTICKAVVEAEEKHVLITHGSDTMTVTGQSLLDAGIPALGKVVVITGALAPAMFRDSDALFNIGMAFAAVQVAQPGVYVAMNGQIFPADGVRKNRERNRFERI
ncbi:MAG: asparaginase domain-containing protein [Pseudomonadota bacterium]